MNRIVLFEQDQINSNQFLIQDEFRLQHITQHLRAQRGDTLRVSVINQGLTQARITSVEQKQLTLELSAPMDRPQHLDLTLIVATSRPPTMKKIVEHGTTLGVTHFHFFTAALSEKSYLQSKVLEPSKLRELTTLGISQSGNLWQMPSFEFSENLSDALKKGDNTQNYQLSLHGSNTLLSKRPNLDNPMAFFIGPERGWTNKEEDYLVDKQVEPILLSQHILRVESAAFALLSQIELLSLSC